MVNIGELTISDPTAAPLRLADFGGRHGPVAEAFEAAPHLAQGLGIALVDQVFKILGEDGLVGGFNNLDFFCQWEGLSHILWKIKKVPNHQPVVDFTWVFKIPHSKYWLVNEDARFFFSDSHPKYTKTIVTIV